MRLISINQNCEIKMPQKHNIVQYIACLTTVGQRIKMEKKEYGTERKSTLLKIPGHFPDIPGRFLKTLF